MAYKHTTHWLIFYHNPLVMCFVSSIYVSFALLWAAYAAPLSASQVKESSDSTNEAPGIRWKGIDDSPDAAADSTNGALSVRMKGINGAPNNPRSDVFGEFVPEGYGQQNEYVSAPRAPAIADDLEVRENTESVDNSFCVIA
ncbi:hypothetical protein C8R43DRAFT_1136904 [Mycena crocata]|nr:hypothetical protein C8R43DRAFT_1136904 [Mycena crocata]